MSATQMTGRATRRNDTEARAGAVALLVLRFTLLGLVVALVGTLGNVAVKLAQG